MCYLLKFQQVCLDQASSTHLFPHSSVWMGSNSITSVCWGDLLHRDARRLFILSLLSDTILTYTLWFYNQTPSNRIWRPVYNPFQIRIMLVHVGLSHIIHHQRSNPWIPIHRSRRNHLILQQRSARGYHHMVLSCQFVGSKVATAIHLSLHIKGVIVGDDLPDRCWLGDGWDLEL